MELIYDTANMAKNLRLAGRVLLGEKSPSIILSGKGT